MYWRIIGRSLLKNKLQTGLSMGGILLATALLILVILLNIGLQAGLSKASAPFPMVAGSRGSSYQLMLNTIFLQDVPLSNMDKATVEKLRKSELVKLAVPLGFGDNYKGERIIGTEDAIFDLGLDINRQQDKWLSLASGRKFAEHNEAVIGSQAARKANLKIGDTFKSLHGLGKSELEQQRGEAHEHGYTVVGILNTSGTPYDDAILVPLESIWEAHHNTEGSATALIIVPKGYSEAMALGNSYQNNEQIQLIYPAQTMLRLFSLLMQGRQVMQAVLGGMLLIVLLMIMIIMYWSVLSRQQERTIMRMLGAGRTKLAGLFIGEGMVITIGGIAGGAVGGHILFLFLSSWLNGQAAIAMPQQFTLLEGGVIAGLLVAGAVVVLLPVYWVLFFTKK